MVVTYIILSLNKMCRACTIGHYPWVNLAGIKDNPSLSREEDNPIIEWRGGQPFIEWIGG